MIPEGREPTPSPSTQKDDVMLAGYRECATEALNWLLGLGYEPGHPLIRSLAAHLTKKQAYLEKLDLERYLIDETFKQFESEFEEGDETDSNYRYELCRYQVENNKEIQRSLVDAAFKGCNLQYCNNLP